MPTLTIDNSFSRVEGLEHGLFEGLRDLLSYRVEENFFSGSPRPTKRYLMNKRGEFPSGLIRQVIQFLSKRCSFDVVDNRAERRLATLTMPIYLKANWGIEGRPEQHEAVKAAMRAHRGTIQAVTGSGKSVMMALLISRMKLRTLIIVPNLALKEQLTRTFRSYFESIDHIVIENIDSSTLPKRTDFDMLIIDESHHVAARTYRELNKKSWTKIYHRYFFTATPFRSKDEEQMLMESISGDVIYRLDYKKAVDKGYIVPVEAYYVDLPKTETDAYTWAEVYKELVVNNECRNDLIMKMMTKIYETGASVLCLVKEVGHGKALSEPSGFLFAHGDAEDCSFLIKNFSDGDYTGLIATTGVAGEGIDTKPCEYVIIAGLGKSKNAFMQQIGRAVRPYPGKGSAKIILFRDKSHKFTRAHFNAQVKILKEEFGVVPVKLNST